MSGPMILVLVLKFAGGAAGAFVLVSALRRYLRSASSRRVYYGIGAAMGGLSLLALVATPAAGAGAVAGLVALITVPLWGVLLSAAQSERLDLT